MSLEKVVTIAKRKETIVFCLFAMMVVLVGLYLYFLSASIMHVVIRKETTRTIAEVSSHIAVLEGRYIEAQHRVSDVVATLEGYEKPAEKIFVKRDAPSLVLRDTNNAQ